MDETYTQKNINTKKYTYRGTYIQKEYLQGQNIKLKRYKLKKKGTYICSNIYMRRHIHEDDILKEQGLDFSREELFNFLSKIDKKSCSYKKNRRKKYISQSKFWLQIPSLQSVRFLQ